MQFVRAVARIAVFALVFTWACDNPTPSGPDQGELLQEETTFTVLGSVACDVDFRELQANARGFFDQPERRDATSLIRDIEDACEENRLEDATTLAWQVLELMERVLDEDRAGSTDDGVGLAKGMLQVAGALPGSGGTDGLDDALGFGGIFAVVDDDRSPEPAVARDAIPVTALDNREYKALYAAAPQEGSDWSNALGMDGVPALIIAHPVQSSFSTNDQLVTDLAYDFDVFPDPGAFAEQLRVAVCFSAEISGDQADLPRMFKNGVLLQQSNDLCDEIPDPSLADASLVRTLFAGLSDLLLPEPLHAVAFSFGGITGGAGSFSEFGSVVASGQGTFEFVTPPPDVISIEEDYACLTADEDKTCALLGTVEVQAQTSEKTPIEAIRVELSIRANQGEPAGAELLGEKQRVTREGDGIATFGEDAKLQVDKAGGYRLCANLAEDLSTDDEDGFQFTEACVDFHVRNN